MLRIVRLNSDIDRASSYYTNDLSQEDYYLKGEEPDGVWSPSLVEHFEGKRVSKELVKKLMEGSIPYGDKKGDLLAKGGVKKSRHAGWDFTFSANKYISIYYARSIGTNRQKIIEDCQRLAVEKTMEFARKHLAVDACRRVKYDKDHEGSKKTTEYETAKSLFYATFQHSTSRQVDKAATPDPQLHTHTLLLNIAEREDGSFGAIETGGFYRHQVAMSRIYESELVDLLSKELSVPFTFSDTGEVKIFGITDEVKEHFSKRRVLIKERLAEEGKLGDSKAAQRLALETRVGKKKLDRQKIELEWQEYLDTNGYTEAQAKLKYEGARELVHTKDELERVGEKLSAEHGAFRKKDLVYELASASLGKGGIDSIENLVDSVREDERLVHITSTKRGVRVYSTRKQIALENGLVEAALSMSSSNNMPADMEHAAKRLAWINAQMLGRKGYEMTSDQKKASFHVLSAGDFVVVEGWAGTGKSTMLNSLTQVYESQGRSVLGVAPTHAARKKLQEEGLSSDTLAKLLHDIENGKNRIDDKTVVFLDEGAMVGTKNLASIVEKCRDAKAKLVVLGDTEQLSSIESGGILKPIIDKVGSCSLTQVVRQKDALQREAAIAMRQGEVDKSLRLLLENNWLKLGKDHEECISRLAASYLESHFESPQKTRIASARRNADVAELNSLIREGLIGKGQIDTSKSFECTIKNSSGLHTKRFCVGEKIVITGNAKRQGLFNGDVGEILSVTETGFLVEIEGKRIDIDPKTFKKFDYGYAVTAYKNQGGTFDESYVLFDSGMKKEDSYVQISRQAETLEVFAPRVFAGNDWTSYRRKLEEGEVAKISSERVLRGYVDLLGQEGKKIPAIVAAQKLDEKEIDRNKKIEDANKTPERDIVTPRVAGIINGLADRSVNKQLIKDLRVIYASPRGVKDPGDRPIRELSELQKEAKRILDASSYQKNELAVLKKLLKRCDVGHAPVMVSEVESQMNERLKKLQETYRHALRKMDIVGLAIERF